MNPEDPEDDRLFAFVFAPSRAQSLARSSAATFGSRRAAAESVAEGPKAWSSSTGLSDLDAVDCLTPTRMRVAAGRTAESVGGGGGGARFLRARATFGLEPWPALEDDDPDPPPRPPRPPPRPPRPPPSAAANTKNRVLEARVHHRDGAEADRREDDRERNNDAQSAPDLSSESRPARRAREAVASRDLDAAHPRASTSPEHADAIAGDEARGSARRRVKTPSRVPVQKGTKTRAKKSVRSRRLVPSDVAPRPNLNVVARHRAAAVASRVVVVVAAVVVSSSSQRARRPGPRSRAAAPSSRRVPVRRAIDTARPFRCRR